MKISEIMEVMRSDNPISELDQYDVKILEMLAANPRATYAELAEPVDLSRDGVKYRIARLEKRGIIKGYSLKLDLRGIGLANKCFVNLAFLAMDDKLAGEFQKFINKEGVVQEVFKTTGSFDFQLIIVSRNNEHLNTILQRIKGAFPGKLAKIEVVPIVE